MRLSVKNRGLVQSLNARCQAGSSLGLELRMRAGARAPRDVTGETGTRTVGEVTAFCQESVF